MANNRLNFKSRVWLYPGQTAAWHFVSVPKKDTAELLEKYKGRQRGWNSLPVGVQIGKTKWDTSIFFDRKSAEYLLPIKASVRKAEKILDKDEVTVTIKIKHLPAN